MDKKTAWAYAELIVDNINTLLDKENITGELRTKNILLYTRDRAKQVRDYLFQEEWQSNGTTSD